MNRIRATVAGVVLLTGALALVPEPASAQGRKRDLITRAELLASAQKSTDLYQAIRSIRPHFVAPPRGVRTIGASPPAPIVVYVDGNRQGDVSVLNSIMTMNVYEVAYLEPSKAQDEYGITHSGGAILIKLFKGVEKEPPSPKKDSTKP